MTRPHGHARPAAAATAHDHAAWGYHSDDERARVAADWLRAGLVAGQRALYVADRPADQLLAELCTINDFGPAAGSGALVVLSTSDAYDLSMPIQPDAQLAMYAGAVDQALADGYTGLRVAADITPLVADSSRRQSHLHWEQVADRFIAERPLAPICMYDTRSIDGIEPIACVHALQGPNEPAFAVFAESADGVALTGEVDGIAAAHLEQIFSCLPDSDDRIDLAGVSFVDGRGAWTIHAAALRRQDEGRPIRLVGAPPAFRRVWELCGFEPSLLDVA